VRANERTEGPLNSQQRACHEHSPADLTASTGRVQIIGSRADMGALVGIGLVLVLHHAPSLEFGRTERVPWLLWLGVPVLYVLV
jgi:hypothetical protein